jgi:hypothetical protein
VAVLAFTLCRLNGCKVTGLSKVTGLNKVYRFTWTARTILGIAAISSDKVSSVAQLLSLPSLFCAG